MSKNYLNELIYIKDGSYIDKERIDFASGPDDSIEEFVQSIMDDKMGKECKCRVLGRRYTWKMRMIAEKFGVDGVRFGIQLGDLTVSGKNVNYVPNKVESQMGKEAHKFISVAKKMLIETTAHNRKVTAYKLSNH